jgi:hypothetical protein
MPARDGNNCVPPEKDVCIRIEVLLKLLREDIR